jgi:hypothetical protein
MVPFIQVGFLRVFLTFVCAQLRLIPMYLRFALLWLGVVISSISETIPFAFVQRPMRLVAAALAVLSQMGIKSTLPYRQADRYGQLIQASLRTAKSKK